MPAELLTPAIRHAVDRISHRYMVIPLLLLLSGHRPLAFLAGQFLYLWLPLAELVGLSGRSSTQTGSSEMQEWARLLSNPQGVAQLEALLLGSMASQARAQPYTRNQ